MGVRATEVPTGLITSRAICGFVLKLLIDIPSIRASAVLDLISCPEAMQHSIKSEFQSDVMFSRGGSFENSGNFVDALGKGHCQTPLPCYRSRNPAPE